MENNFIVAIELGSSKISGIAGKKENGTWQVLAYAEERASGCIKRGAVYNIEKTYQCVNNIIAKLENVLKSKITRVYVGMAGQSVHSHKSLVKRNLLTHSLIREDIIDSIREESTDIPFSGYEMLDNIPQEYKVDSNTLNEPIGVMGTNIEGEFLNIIAKQKLSQNIDTVFANVGVTVLEKPISTITMANNVLTDSEKRSGCALVDLGADTTTLVIYKNNIVRYLVTIPLGCNNINKDLCSLPIDENEAEDIKLKYGDACAQDTEVDENEEKFYTTLDGRQVDISLIRQVIEARIVEIIVNVRKQLENANFSNSSKLLAGLVLTGGGCNMTNIAEAFKNHTQMEKVRVAKKVNVNVQKTSNAPSLVLESGMTNTIVALMLEGKEPCGGDQKYDNGDMFQSNEEREKLEAIRKKKEEEERVERENCHNFDLIKGKILDAYNVVQAQIKELEAYGSNKDVRNKARELSLSIVENTLGVNEEIYNNAYNLLEGKDKYKQSLREGNELVGKLKDSKTALVELVNQKHQENTMYGRFVSFLKGVTSED